MSVLLGGERGKGKIRTERVEEAEGRLARFETGVVEEGDDGGEDGDRGGGAAGEGGFPVDDDGVAVGRKA